MTDEQQTLIASATEEEMVDILAVMRKKADEQGWIWEDIEELADQQYWSAVAAKQRSGVRHFGI